MAHFLHIPNGRLPLLYYAGVWVIQELIAVLSEDCCCAIQACNVADLAATFIS